MSTGSGIPLDQAGETWDALAKIVERFLEAWEANGDPPVLTTFVPAEPAALRRLAQVELIKIDLEYRWGERRLGGKVENYLADMPDLAEDVPPHLLFDEFHLRKQAGDEVAPEEYLKRFPKLAEELKKLFDIESFTSSTTTLVHTKELANLENIGEIEDFSLQMLLGQGAFAKVFLAWQKSMQRTVALKISADKGVEPQTLAKLDHPNIVRVFDQRQVPERGLRLMYMQMIPGGTLQNVVSQVRKTPAQERTGRLLLESVDKHLERQSPMSQGPSIYRQRLANMRWPEVVASVGMRLAHALDHAANQGVLHRDVKPANVLLTSDGVPKLTDFNVSFGSTVEGATPAAFFGGSLGYMSPEQLDAFNPGHSIGPESLDHRSDIYSLGVLLWELTTGYRPFQEENLEPNWRETLSKMAARRRDGVLAGMVAIARQEGSPALVDVLLKCLSPEPSERPDGKSLARQLALCLDPQARELLEKHTTGWRGWARRRPILATLLIALWPNILAAAFHFIYYHGEVIDRMTDESARNIFVNVHLGIDLVAFPIGVAAFIWIAWPVSRALNRSGGAVEESQEIRQRCLYLGWYGSFVSLMAWLVGSIVYPVALLVAMPELDTAKFLGFMGSLVVCGLFAAVYPFFCATFLVLRVFYPTLAKEGETEDLLGLSRWMSLYLGLSAIVPFLALATLGLTLHAGSDQLPLVLLVIGGGVGTGLAWMLNRVMQADLERLAFALQTTEQMMDTGSESWRVELPSSILRR